MVGRKIKESVKSALAPNKCFITRVQSLSVQVGCFYLRLDLGLHLLLADSVGQCAWAPQPGAGGAGLAGLPSESLVCCLDLPDVSIIVPSLPFPLKPRSPW